MPRKNFNGSDLLHRGITANPNVMEMNLVIPLASLVGSYKIKGKVLILPIQGEGISNMTMGKAGPSFQVTTQICNVSRSRPLSIIQQIVTSR